MNFSINRSLKKIKNLPSLASCVAAASEWQSSKTTSSSHRDSSALYELSRLTQFHQCVYEFSILTAAAGVTRYFFFNIIYWSFHGAKREWKKAAKQKTLHFDWEFQKSWKEWMPCTWRDSSKESVRGPDVYISCNPLLFLNSTVWICQATSSRLYCNATPWKELKEEKESGSRRTSEK